MEHTKDGRSKEEKFSQLLLKSVQDLSKRIEEMGQRISNSSKGKGVQGDFQIGEGTGTSQHQVAPHTTMLVVPYTSPRSTILKFLALGTGGQ